MNIRFLLRMNFIPSLNWQASGSRILAVMNSQESHFSLNSSARAQFVLRTCLQKWFSGSQCRYELVAAASYFFTSTAHMLHVCTSKVAAAAPDRHAEMEKKKQITLMTGLSLSKMLLVCRSTDISKVATALIQSVCSHPNQIAKSVLQGWTS